MARIENRLTYCKLRVTRENRMNLQQDLSPLEGDQRDALSISNFDPKISSNMVPIKEFATHVVDKVFPVT